MGLHMRILGVFVGLFIGAMVGEWWLALVLAGLGAYALPKLANKESDKPRSDEAAIPHAEDFFPTDERLKARVAQLEQRVAALELRLQTAGAVAPAEVPSFSQPEPEPTPVAVPASVPEPAQLAVPVPAPVPVPVPIPIAPPAPIAQPPAAAPAPVRPKVVVPPPAPAVPLRERLPAPLANLIFGGNMLVKMGALILFLGLAFLLRYTAERVTVPVELRYLAVALAGAGLLVVGWLLRRKRADYALVLQGAGIGVFYLTTLAAMKLHMLLPPTAGFGFLFAVAVLSAVLAVVQKAPVLAIVAALEGFAAPVLASTGQNNPVGLFTYLLVLDVGIFLVAWFQAWRVLNLIGAVGTFTLAAGWAQRNYTDDQFGVVQPFLIVFFLLFTAIGLLFARRTLRDAVVDATQSLTERAVDTLRRVGRVDSALVFGVPMAAFGMEYLMVRPWEMGAAYAAMGFAAVYLVLARVVFATQPRGLALLAEAYAIVGVIFGTLAIPLALEGRWTGAAWAIEAAGMYWLGVRQARPYARAFSFVVFAGAVFKLLQATTVDGAPGHALFDGSLIGPLLVALGAFAMWVLHLRAKLDEEGEAGPGWEALCGMVLPWLGMAALTLLLWQTLVPMWAAVATAGLALAAFAVAVRGSLQPLVAVSYGMQALAVVSFIATLHRGSGDAALASGVQGALAACLIALCVLACVGYSMWQLHRAALARAEAPQWSLGNQLAAVTGVGLLHLAMLFQVSWEQAALLWPLTACAVLWVALRWVHPALALQAAALHVVSAVLFDNHRPLGGTHDLVQWPAFAHLGFWTPVVLGLTALLSGDWLNRHAARVRWGQWLLVQWVPLGIGMLWWLQAMLLESTRVLELSHLAAYAPAAWLAVVVVTSAVALLVAQRRQWEQLGRATLATLGGMVLVALAAVVWADTHSTDALVQMGTYVPSTGFGWLVWPLAAWWHLRLLKAQRVWFGESVLGVFHTAGLWLFVMLGARQCQWMLGHAGDGGVSGSSWQLLGWVLVPALTLWALQMQRVRQRWPMLEYRHAYVHVAATPIAAYLLLWAWVTNASSAGYAAPLPYVPVLNPLELAHWLVLVAVLLWWRTLPTDSFGAVPGPVAKVVVGATGLALLTGMVLRSCHHYADVPWAADALYASRLTQAALSVTWALCGVLAMVLGHRVLGRKVWMAGATLLGVVVLKLFFVELADQGGLFRIVSFLSVGVLLLLVGYFAPVPPARETTGTDKEAA
jgi:uncharacterized membrane protein